MAVTTTTYIDGDDRVINIELRALQTKADNLANDCARYAYEIYWQYDDQFKTGDDITPYDNLTNQQKLSIIGLETQRLLKKHARTYYINDAANTARDTATTEAGTRY